MGSILPAQLCKVREDEGIQYISIILPIITRVGDTVKETDTKKEKEQEKGIGKRWKESE